MTKSISRRTKKPTCRKASAYACGFSCISMTKQCRQELAQQGTQLANAFAEQANAQPVLQKQEPIAFEELLERKTSASLLGVTNDKRTIKYNAFEAMDFELDGTLSSDDSLSPEEIADQLQNWNGKTYEVIWTPLVAPKSEKEALVQALDARRAWPAMLAKFEPGTLLYNAPTPDATVNTDDEDYRNRRARLYERNGFGKLEKPSDETGYFSPRQMGIVQQDGTVKPVQLLKGQGLKAKYAQGLANAD